MLQESEPDENGVRETDNGNRQQLKVAHDTNKVHTTMTIQDNKIHLDKADIKTIAAELADIAEQSYDGNDYEKMTDVEIEVEGGRVYVDCGIDYIYNYYRSHDPYLPDEAELIIRGIDIDRIDAWADDEAYDHLAGDEITDDDYKAIRAELEKI